MADDGEAIAATATKRKFISGFAKTKINLSNGELAKLAHIAGNTTAAPAAFYITATLESALDYHPILEEPDLEVIGEALQKNKTISCFGFNLDFFICCLYGIGYLDEEGNDSAFLNKYPIPSMMENICDFVATNPALRLLHFKASHFTDYLLEPLLAAAAKNKRARIENITVIAAQDTLGPMMEPKWGDLLSVKEWQFDGCPAGFLEAFPEGHVINKFRCHLPSSDVDREMRMFENLCIKHLVLEDWRAHLPLYIMNPTSNLRRLDFSDTCFSHGTFFEGQSLMDGLISGLLASRTMETLNFDDCKFDSLSLQKLVRAFKLEWKPMSVKHLGFHFSLKQAFDLDWSARLLDCKALETFVFSGLYISNFDEMFEAIHPKLAASALSSFGFRTNNFSQWAPHLNALASLDLVRCDLDTEGAACLVRMLEDEMCNLERLQLHYWKGATKKTIGPKLLQSLGGTGTLQKIVLEHHCKDTTDALYTALIEFLGRIKSLTELEILGPGQLSLELEDDLLEAFSSNWSLETVLFVEDHDHKDRVENTQCNYDELDNHLYRMPNTSALFENDLEGIMQRNQSARHIFASTWSIISWLRDDTITRLQYYFELPDSQTLTFWLLHPKPASTFPEEGDNADE